jgi:hypothetical protein
MDFCESIEKYSLHPSQQKDVVPFSSLWLIEYVLITFNYRALINPNSLLRLEK